MFRHFPVSYCIPSCSCSWSDSFRNGLAIVLIIFNMAVVKDGTRYFPSVFSLLATNRSVEYWFVIMNSTSLVNTDSGNSAVLYNFLHSWSDDGPRLQIRVRDTRHPRAADFPPGACLTRRDWSSYVTWRNNEGHPSRDLIPSLLSPEPGHLTSVSAPANLEEISLSATGCDTFGLTWWLGYSIACKGRVCRHVFRSFSYSFLVGFWLVSINV